MKNRTTLLALFVLLFVAVSPSLAQGDDATVVTSTFQYALMLGLGVALLALVLIVLYFGDKLYKAVPPQFAGTALEVTKGVTDSLLKFIEDRKTEAAGNDVDWDDPIWETLYNEAKRRREALDSSPQG